MAAPKARYPAKKGGKVLRKRRKAQEGGLAEAARAPRRSDIFSLLTGQNVEELTLQYVIRLL